MLTLLRTERGAVDVDQLAEIARRAADLGYWGPAITATMNVALSSLHERPVDIPTLLLPAREMAAAHGALDDVAWTWYFESEAEFMTGDWDSAVNAGRTAMDIGEANAYRRVTVRAIHVMVPIASARGDREMLERAAAFYRSLTGKFEFPDSPYSRIVRPAQDIELAAAGLWQPYVPDVEPRLGALRDIADDPSWLAAVDCIFRTWLDAGRVEDAGRAVAAMDKGRAKWRNVSPIVVGQYRLLRGRLAGARGDDAVAVGEARAALEAFRAAPAPWWTAKAIRLLERVEAADDQQLAEVAEIERSLGAVRPTA